MSSSPAAPAPGTAAGYQAADWVANLIEEAATFPNATNDDQVDAFSQAINWAREHPTGYATTHVPQGRLPEQRLQQMQGQAANHPRPIPTPSNHSPPTSASQSQTAATTATSTEASSTRTPHHTQDGSGTTLASTSDGILEPHACVFVSPTSAMPRAALIELLACAPGRSAGAHLVVGRERLADIDLAEAGCLITSRKARRPGRAQRLPHRGIISVR